MYVIYDTDTGIVSRMSLSEDSPLNPGKHYVDGACIAWFVSKEHLKELKQFSLDPSDVIVTGYPRSGIHFVLYIKTKLPFQI